MKTPVAQYSICRATVSLNIPNSTHYFNPFTRTHNRVRSQESFAYDVDKRNNAGYRCYWENEDCRRQGGALYFYTLTYNDANLVFYETDDIVPLDSRLPVIPGLRLPEFNKPLVTKIFNTMKHYFERNYGADMTYCIAPEFGEGKGKRGYGNNPHLHILLGFRQKVTKDGEMLSFRAPKESEITDVLKKQWQYTIISKDMTHNGLKIEYVKTDWENAFLGHVEDGRIVGKHAEIASTSTHSAIAYAAKYCTKDHQKVQIAHFNSVLDYWKAFFYYHSVCNDSINKFHEKDNENSSIDYPTNIIYDDYVGGVPTSFWTSKGNKRKKYFESDESFLRPDVIAYRMYHSFASSNSVFSSNGCLYFYDEELLCDVPLTFTNWVISSKCPFEIKEYFYNLDYRNPWHRLIIYLFYNTDIDSISQNYYIARRINEYNELHSLFDLLIHSDAQIITESDLTNKEKLKLLLLPCIQCSDLQSTIENAKKSPCLPYYLYTAPMHLDKIAGLYTKYYYEVYVPLAIKERMSDYTQNFVVRFHFSQGFGEYGFSQIDDNGNFTVREKNTFKTVPITSYYIRKYYFDWSICPQSGNVRYTPNMLFIRKRLNDLPKTIDININSMKTALSFFDLNPKIHVLPYLENALLNNHEYTDASVYYDRFVQTVRSSIDDELIRKYSIYNIVYRSRYYSETYADFSIRLTDNFDIDDVKSDYLKILSPIATSIENYHNGICYQRNALREDFSSDRDFNRMELHPSIAPLINFAKVMDIIRETFDLYTQQQKRSQYERKGKQIEIINRNKYNNAYGRY